jgi:hypothetical protein
VCFSGRPTGFDFQRQNRRKGARCQPNQVGVTVDANFYEATPLHAGTGPLHGNSDNAATLLMERVTVLMRPRPVVDRRRVSESRRPL